MAFGAGEVIERVEERQAAGAALERTFKTSSFAKETTLEERLELLKLGLPDDHRPFTDKYFLRANEILKHEGINPWVRGQVFIRKGPGEAAGIDQALAIIDKYTDLIKNGGRVYALEEGAAYAPKETLMVIEGRAQDIVELETMYLGVLAAETTKKNDGVDHVDLDAVTKKAKEIRELIGDTPLIYMGARHWSWDEDSLIAKAAIEGGASTSSTDVGAFWAGAKGVGTIPHVLENILAYFYGKKNAVREAAVAFDRAIDPDVPRVALIDYNNKEIDDALAVARALHGKTRTPAGVRLDTCGENLAQGAFAKAEDIPEGHPLKAVLKDIPAGDLKFWFGNGVTVTAAYAVRRALDENGFGEMKLMLSSGFAKPEKVRAFVRAKKILGMKLFDGLGAGELFEPCRSSKMDIVAVAGRREDLDKNPISKAGRSYNPNPKLKLVMGGTKQ